VSALTFGVQEASLIAALGKKRVVARASTYRWNDGFFGDVAEFVYGLLRVIVMTSKPL
jgi:hypothetical protein